MSHHERDKIAGAMPIRQCTRTLNNANYSSLHAQYAAAADTLRSGIAEY